MQVEKYNNAKRASTGYTWRISYNNRRSRSLRVFHDILRFDTNFANCFPSSSLCSWKPNHLHQSFV